MNCKKSIYDPATKIWSGPRCPPMYNPDANLGYLFMQRLIQQPKSIFQICDDTGVKLTCADVYERSLKFASYFTRHNLKQGDVVGLIASNSENVAPIMFGCFVIGVAVNPISVEMKENEIEHMWGKTKPKIIFTDGKIAAKVKEGVDKIKLDAKIFTLISKIDGFQFVDQILDEYTDWQNYIFPDLPNISSTIAIINCSSGTTKIPKGVCLSHKKLIELSILPFDSNLKDTDVNLITFLPYWILHILYSTYCVMYNIPNVITSQPVTPENWMDIIDRQKVTVVFIPSPYAARVLNSEKVRPLKSLRILTVGGGVISERTMHELQAIVPNGIVINAYGLTETGRISATTDMQGSLSAVPDEYTGLSSGYLHYNVRVKICDENGTALEPNKVGEIYAITGTPFSGYFGEPEVYNDCFDSEGFVKTGDAGYFDDSGKLYVLDRVEHMIKSIGSYQVTPREIENYIDEIPGVKYSSVVGIYDPDYKYEKIHAFVIKKDNAPDGLNESFIVNHVNAKVGKEKQITGGVYFVNEFPNAPNGNLLKRELKQLAAKMGKLNLKNMGSN
ncbi:uncharacterized protein [Chironomus tepperi]|uniref:uncharacterized protein n=1 Tax=Chironomus tepperi TaxID=113505 RepID=UPI00391EFB3B